MVKIKDSQWNWWWQLRKRIRQQEVEYDLLKQASEEEREKLIASHNKELSKLREALDSQKKKVAELRSKNEVLLGEATEADKKKNERELVIHNLADENSALREKIRNLRERNSILSGQNAKKKKQIESLPQRGANGRFVKKKADAPELKPVSVEAKHKVTDK